MRYHFTPIRLLKKKSIIEKMEQWVTAGENVPVTATLRESLAISGRVGDS